MTAQLIGIGVGTGDADLITLKAYKLLQSAGAENTVLAYITTPEKPSMARQIVAPYIPKSLLEIVLTMPMRIDTTAATVIYDGGAEQILSAIQDGKTVLFLCEGDPLFYGSFMYIYSRLHPQVSIDIIPGITAVSSACSVAKIPFASRNDICTIVPAPVDLDILIHHLQSANSIAIIKIGRHLHKVKTALVHTHRLNTAICVKYATLPQQHITPVAEVTEAPYFSVVISTKQNLY